MGDRSNDPCPNAPSPRPKDGPEQTAACGLGNKAPRRFAIRSGASHRAAITGVFFLNGAVFAAWYARLPAIQDELSLTPGQVGIALLGAPVGLLLAQPATGLLVARRGSRPVVAAAPLSMLAVALPAVAVDLPTLVAAVFVVGAANGALDIAMNTNGLAVERCAGRPLFSSLHAAFSFGALTGAAAAGAFAAVGVEPLAHLLAWAGVGAIAALLLVPHLLTDEATERPAGGVRRRLRPSSRLLVLSTIAFCALLAEGAVFDWSGIFLAREAGATEGVAALGLALFSLSMGVGRLGGDAMRVRVGAAVLARVGAAAAAVGLALAVAVSTVPVALAGFGLMGIGLSVVFPLTLRVAGRETAQQLAAVSAIGYTGFLAGPPLIGLLAELGGLRGALILAVAACVLAAALASALREADDTAAPRPSA